MPEFDEFGIPIKKVKSTETVDEFGIPIKKKELTPSPSSFGKYPSSLPEEVSPIMGGGKRVERQPVLDKRTTALNPLVALEETKGNAPLPQPKTEELQSFRQTGATFPDAEVDKSSGLPEIKGAALGFSSVVSSTLKSIGVAAKDIDLFNEYKGKKAEDLVTYKAGKWIEDKVKDLTGGLSKEEQDMFSVKLAQGVGQMGGFMLGGIGGKALKFSPVLTSAALGAAVNASSEYENAIQSGATPDQAAKVFWINGVIGTTEALPIMSAFNKLDKYTGGLATGALSRKLSSTIGGRITNEIAQGFVTEAAQEATQQLMTNTVAANTYDVTRSIYDGLLESAAIGGIIGASMNGVVSSIREKRAAGGLTKEEDTQLAAAQEFAEQKAAEALDPSKTEVTTSTNNNPKVKAITKAKTDIEADLAHNENLPEDTKATMQTEVEALDQELEVAKTETYQQELDSKTAMVLQDNIAKNEMLLEDATLTEGTKAIIQRNIDTDKEKLSQLPIPTPPIIEGKGEEISQPVELSTEISTPASTKVKEGEPSIEQQLKEVKEGNVVTFEYNNESEVPEIFKDKISSKGEINGKPYVKVTMAKSLADFHLKEQAAKPTPSGIKSEEVFITPEDIDTIKANAESNTFILEDNFKEDAYSEYINVESDNLLSKLEKVGILKKICE